MPSTQKSLMTEGKANTHLTHLEELVLTQGPKGYQMARAFLLELLETLKGNSKSHVQTSVKWDGAPAIFAGINPENGQFFVGTKSIFNKVPKINYTAQDIIDNHGHAPGLVDKLTKALKYLPSLGINNILQGDFMFDDGMLDVAEIDGEPHYRFKPNTIVYAVPVDSDLGSEIGKSKFGIVFHTTYDSLDSGASFGADVSGLNRVPGIWFDDAFFTDDTGTVTLTVNEERHMISLVKQADEVNKEIDYDNLPFAELNVYINSEIKAGHFLENPERSFKGFSNWVEVRNEKRVDGLKSVRGRERAHEQGLEKLNSIIRREEDILNLFRVSRLLFEAKNIFIVKYNNAVYNTKHFVDDGSGDLVATNPEGYVAVDHAGNGVKFVDRLEFSRANFLVDKSAKFKQNESLTVYWGDDGFSTTKTLSEWATNLPKPSKTNKALYKRLQEAAPITSLVKEASKVKQSLAEAIYWALDEQTEHRDKEERIAAVAGGFKPPHRGHMEMIQHYTGIADKVKLFIGENPRPIKGDKGGRSISAEQSLAVWQHYLSDAGLSDRVEIEVVAGSPMKSAYSVLENAQPGQTILMGCGAKDTYFTPEALAKYAPEGVSAEAAPCPTILDPDTELPYKAEHVRDTIRDNNFEMFSKYIPLTSVESASEIFSLLGGGLKEMSGMGGGAVAGFSGPVGKPNRRKHKEDKLVNEVVNYLLGISVG